MLSRFFLISSVKSLFGKGGGLMGKGSQFLEGGSGFSEIAIMNFLQHNSHLTYYLCAD